MLFLVFRKSGICLSLTLCHIHFKRDCEGPEDREGPQLDKMCQAGNGGNNNQGGRRNGNNGRDNNQGERNGNDERPQGARLNQRRNAIDMDPADAQQLAQELAGVARDNIQGAEDYEGEGGK